MLIKSQTDHNQEEANGVVFKFKNYYIQNYIIIKELYMESYLILFDDHIIPHCRHGYTFKIK